MQPSPRISAVVPAFNEVDNLPALFAEMRAALEATGETWELVLVDDGSSDGSDRVMRDEAARDARVRVLYFARNAGQSAALAAGLAEARGEVIVTMDADLQNDPADLPRVLGALEHADVVSGVRQNRQDSWLRLVSSRIANGVRRNVLGDPITDIGCSFKAYRRETLLGLPMFVGVHRFLPALCVFRGARLVEVQLAHRPRRAGVSKYGVGNRLWRGLADLVGVQWLKARLLRYQFKSAPR